MADEFRRAQGVLLALPAQGAAGWLRIHSRKGAASERLRRFVARP